MRPRHCASYRQPLDAQALTLEARGRSLRNLAIAAMLLVLVAALIVWPILLPTQGNDAETVAQLSNSADLSDIGDGYSFMAFLYSHTSRVAQFMILLGFGGGLVGTSLWWLRTPRFMALCCFLLLAPIFLYLPFFIKDTFATPLSIGAVLLLLSNRLPSWIKIGGSVFLYAIYAVIFRQYYLLIAGAWLGVLLFLRLSWPWRVVLLTAIPLALLVVPASVYNSMQMQRDVANMARVGFAGAGNRTAFLNLLRPDGVGTFIINYLYAAFRLNLPILNAGLKEAYLFINLCLYGWLAWTGLRSGNPRVVRPAALFVSHVLILVIFEPDLGSYLRHLSTAVLMLVPSLVMHDRLFFLHGRNALRPSPPLTMATAGTLRGSKAEAGLRA